MQNKIGDIVLIPFPFSDLSDTKVRPCVILQFDREDILVVFITTKKPVGEFMPIAHNEVNNLITDSFIRYTKISALDKKMIMGTLGELSPKELITLKLQIRKFLQL